MIIDRTFLPADLDPTPGDGFYAEFYPSGAVKSFAFYRDGVLTGELLELGDSNPEAKTTTIQEFTCSSGCETIEELESEFSDWVRWRIGAITDRAQFILRCSFCEKSQAEVFKLIAGPQCYICNECVIVCSEILSAP